MRLLLDESLPRPLADLLIGYDVRTRLESLEPLLPDILQVLETLQPNVLIRVGGLTVLRFSRVG